MLHFFVRSINKTYNMNMKNQMKVTRRPTKYWHHSIYGKTPLAFIYLGMREFFTAREKAGSDLTKQWIAAWAISKVRAASGSPSLPHEPLSKPIPPTRCYNNNNCDIPFFVSGVPRPPCMPAGRSSNTLCPRGLKSKCLPFSSFFGTGAGGWGVVL